MYLIPKRSWTSETVKVQWQNWNQRKSWINNLTDMFSLTNHFPLRSLGIATQPIFSYYQRQTKARERETEREKNRAKQTSKQIRLTLQQQPVKFSYRVFYLIPVHIFACYTWRYNAIQYHHRARPQEHASTSRPTRSGQFSLTPGLTLSLAATSIRLTDALSEGNPISASCNNLMDHSLPSYPLSPRLAFDSCPNPNTEPHLIT